MHRLRRIALIGGLVFIGVLVVAVLGLRGFLSSSQAKNIAADRISTMIGLPVAVDELSVGGSSSSMKLRILSPEEDPAKPQTEIAKVESATADVSLLDLITGQVSPKTIVLKGVSVTLTLDENGRILTPLPKPGGGNLPAGLPNIRIEDAAVTINQAGRAPFTMAGIRTTATNKDDSYDFSGEVADSHWGTWVAKGTLNLKEKAGSVEFDTADGRLEPELLRTIPFVPPSTWEHVSATGRSAATVRIESRREKMESILYEVTLRPEGRADLTVSDLDATLTQIFGTIRIAGQKIEIEDGRATLADGTVRVAGTLDFASEPSNLEFKVSVQDLDVRKLPPNWSLPPQLTGKLKGHADLTLLVPAEGKVEPRGGGDGTVEGAAIAGLPADIQLHLRSDGKRYRFDTKPAGKRSDAGLRFGGYNGFFLLVAPIPQAPQTSAQSNPTTLDAAITLRDIKVGELLEKLGVNIPYHLAGKVTVQVSASVPVGGVIDRKSYRLRGTITSPNFQFESLEVHDLSADLRYRDGILTLTALQGRIPSANGTGKILGSATAQVEPRGDLSAKLELADVPLEELAKAVPGGLNLRGSVSGNADFRAPIERFNDASTWSGSATLTGKELAIFERSVRDVRTTIRLDSGKLQVANLAVNVEGLKVTGEGSLNLASPYPYSARFQTTPTTITDVRRLVPEVRIPFEVEGKITTQGSVSGEITPFSITAKGNAKVTDLKLGSTSSNDVSFNWNLSPKTLTITEFAAKLFQGIVTGSGEIPLNAKESGKLSLEFKDVDASATTKLVPDFPVPLGGKVSGKVSAETTISDGRRAVSADLDLAAPKLLVRGIPAERLAGKVTVADGFADYSLEGHTLGGTFEVKGTYPARPKEKKKNGDRGHIRLRNLDLARLSIALSAPSLEPLKGQIDANFEYDTDLSNGLGRVTLQGLRWGRDSFGSDLTGSVELHNGVIDVRDFGGRVAGGNLRVRARYDVDDPRRNFYSVTLERALIKDIARLVPDFSTKSDGEVTLSARGNFGAQGGGNATVSISSGTFAGLSMTDLQIPIQWTGGLSTGEIAIRNATGRLANGRVVADVSYHYGLSGRLSGTVKFNDVRLKTLVGGTTNVFGNGRISGRFDLAGNSIRTLDDIGGTLNGTLNQTSVREVPLLQVVTPFLSPTALASPFETGEIKGRLAGGIFRIERLSLANQGAKVFAEGAVSRKGRVDLEVVAVTGQVGPNIRALKLLGLSIPAFGTIPVVVIQEVSDLLSNRSIRLTVTGTVAQPVVRVNTAAFLTESAVRFFIGQYVLPE